MTRPDRRRLAAATLAAGALLAVSALPAQGPPCSTPPGNHRSLLEIGYIDPSNPGQFLWVCPESGAPLNLTGSGQYIFTGKVRVRAAKGTWYTLMMRTFVRDALNPGSAAEEAFFTAHPELDPYLRPPVSADPGTLFPFQDWSGQYRVWAPPAIFAAMTWIGVTWPFFQTLDEDVIKCTHQPVLADDPANPGMAMRNWSARPPIWLSPPLNAGYAALGQAWADVVWTPYSLDPTNDPEVFAWEAFSRMGVFLQIPDPLVAANFLAGDAWTQAFNLGIFVTLQAVAAKSGDPSAVFTNDELTTAGLQGIVPDPPGFQFFAPIHTITNPVTIQLAQGIPSTCGCGGGPSTIPVSIRRGDCFNFKARNIVHPSAVTFPILAAIGQPATALIPIQPIPDFTHPFRVRVCVPLNAVLGVNTFPATNGFGMTNASFFMLDVEPIPNPGGGGTPPGGG